jgi:hypothetical protein
MTPNELGLKINQTSIRRGATSVEDVVPTPEKEWFNRPRKIAAFVLAGVVFIGIAIAASCTNQSKDKPTGMLTPTPTEQGGSPTPSASPEISPTSSAEILPTVESLEFDAKGLSSPELLIQTWVDRQTAWYNSGATPENARAAVDGYNTMTLPEYAAKVSSDYDGIFIDALFPSDWQSNQILADIVDRTTKVHTNTLMLYFKTFDNTPEDQEAYKRGVKYVQTNSVTSNADGSVSIKYTEHAWDNSDKNRAGEALTQNKSIDTDNITPTVIFKIVDGKLVIVNIIPVTATE